MADLVPWATLASALIRSVGANRMGPSAVGEFERLVADELGGEPFRERSAESLSTGPDVIVHRGHRDPLLVEVKALSHAGAGKNLNNRLAELTSAAVVDRRLFPTDVALTAVLGVAGSPHQTWETALSDPMDPVATRIRLGARRLLRSSTDGVGFDSVLVGLLGGKPRWLRLDPNGDEEVDLSTEDAFARLKATVAATEPAHGTPSVGSPPRFLFVADEWRSGKGGLTTINRELAVALAACGCEVAVMVPTTDTTDRDEATGLGVSLVSPYPVPGLQGKSLLTLPPRFDDPAFSPDYIVGHGRVLGPYAFAMQTHFPKARRIHLVHTASDFLEAAKERLGGPSLMEQGDERRVLESTLARSAHLVLGVGPYLTRWIAHALRGMDPLPPVMELRPGLRDWGYELNPADPPGMNQVLVVARAEDLHSKGLDVAAAAVVAAATRLGPDPAVRPTLIVRGVPTDHADEVKQALESRIHPYADLILRPYTDSEAALKADFWQSRVVLMPSRHEGFGLSAYEAIAAGVPTLISEESGLAEFLSIALGGTVPEVLPIRGNTDDVADAWGDAIFNRLSDPIEAFARASALRETVGSSVTWALSAASLLETLAEIDATA